MVAKLAKKILVVEDDLLLAEIIKALLETESHNVNAAENGRDAIAELEVNRYDVIITDLHMPDIDGLALIDWVSNHQPTIKVVVVSATPVQTIAQLIDQGAIDAFYKKPIDESIMNELIKLLNT